MGYYIWYTIFLGLWLALWCILRTAGATRPEPHEREKKKSKKRLDNYSFTGIRKIRTLYGVDRRLTGNELTGILSTLSIVVGTLNCRTRSHLKIDCSLLCIRLESRWSWFYPVIGISISVLISIFNQSGFLKHRWLDWAVRTVLFTALWM